MLKVSDHLKSVVFDSCLLPASEYNTWHCCRATDVKKILLCLRVVLHPPIE